MVATVTAGDIGVRQFVDEGDLRGTFQDRFEVHLAERRAAVVAFDPRHGLQALQHRLGVRPSVALDEADDDIAAAGGAAPALVQHPVGLAHSGGRPEEDLEPARPFGPPPIGRGGIFGRRHRAPSLRDEPAGRIARSPGEVPRWGAGEAPGLPGGGVHMVVSDLKGSWTGPG
jgi:hypothetical protein